MGQPTGVESKLPSLLAWAWPPPTSARCSGVMPVLALSQARPRCSAPRDGAARGRRSTSGCASSSAAARLALRLGWAASSEARSRSMGLLSWRCSGICRQEGGRRHAACCWGAPTGVTRRACNAGEAGRYGATAIHQGLSAPCASQLQAPGSPLLPHLRQRRKVPLDLAVRPCHARVGPLLPSLLQLGRKVVQHRVQAGGLVPPKGLRQQHGHAPQLRRMQDRGQRGGVNLGSPGLTLITARRTAVLWRGGAARASAACRRGAHPCACGEEQAEQHVQGHPVLGERAALEAGGARQRRVARLHRRQLLQGHAACRGGAGGGGGEGGGGQGRKGAAHKKAGELSSTPANMM